MTGMVSPILHSCGKAFETIRSHFFSTLKVFEPSYSNFLSFMSIHVIFAIILKSVSSHGAGVFSCQVNGFQSFGFMNLRVPSTQLFR